MLLLSVSREKQQWGQATMKGTGEESQLLPPLLPLSLGSQRDADTPGADWVGRVSQGQCLYLVGFLIWPRPITVLNICSEEQSGNGGYESLLWGLTS